MAVLKYFQSRNEVWRFNNLWEDEVEEVREYLKREWKENVNTRDVDAHDKECLRTEANQILRWWWERRYGYRGQNCTEHCEHYGKWLLERYHEARKVNILNNTADGPRIEITCSVKN